MHPDNEDALLMRPDLGLFAVADGLGGQKAGEVASRLALETIEAAFGTMAGQARKSDLTQMTEILDHALAAAHERLKSLSRQRYEFRGMGCTVVVIRIDGGMAHVANVGDARAYLSRGNGIIQLSTDHTGLPLRVSPDIAPRRALRGDLTQALGMTWLIRPLQRQVDLLPGDRLLLCSDGLTDVLSDEQLQRTLRGPASDSSVCDLLVDEAVTAGALDDVTAVVVRVSEQEDH